MRVRFRLDDGEVEVTAAPDAVGLRWRDPGEAREALDALLGRVSTSGLAHVAATVAEGRVLERLPPDTARRWVVDTRMPESPDRFRAWSPGDDAVIYGPRRELVAAVELLLRVALAPYEGRDDVPPWVPDARLAHVLLLACADARFEDA